MTYMFFHEGVQESSGRAETYKYTYYYYALNYQGLSCLYKILKGVSFCYTPDTFHLKDEIARRYN